MEGQDQDRTEEATPFKLKRAREKGQVARGMDLGFVGSLLAFAAFILLAGPAFVARLAELMRLSLTVGIDQAGHAPSVLATVKAVYWMAFQPLLLLGGVIAVVLISLELIQLRGFIFTAAPLKPDFSRLNPAKGLKRIFSLRMIKETLKNIAKMAVYSMIAWLMISSAIRIFGDTLQDAVSLSRALEGAAKRLLFAFLGAAFLFMLLDQVMVRREFGKQMRMSRRELTRETKDREGEPRLKQKRRELHGEMRKQAEGLGQLPGSDFVVTNPDHFAVALAYRPDRMDAPMVRAKGRSHFAQLLKRKARLLGIPLIADPALARRLFRETEAGKPIAPTHFHDVARHYGRLRRAAEQPEGGDASHG